MALMSAKANAEVVRVSSLREFFMDSVTTAMESNQLAANHETEHYVVNLLTLFARAEVFHDPADDSPRGKPLALMLVAALEAPTPEERAFRLQRLGDVSLFIAGFFADDLQHSVVDLDYYISMGGGAYSSLSTQTRGTSRARTFGPVFAELGEKFHHFVDVLNDVRDQACQNSDTNLLRLYEVWRKTDSARAERLLRKNGVYPMSPGLMARSH